MKLRKRKCIPYEGTEIPLTIKEFKKFLEEIKDWKIIDNLAIEKDFHFENFKESIKFVNKVAKVSEKEKHHPNILLHHYRNVRITLSTHSIKGLSENDFILAAKIDELSHKN